jgi:hypothetical protein
LSADDVDVAVAVFVPVAVAVALSVAVSLASLVGLVLLEVCVVVVLVAEVVVAAPLAAAMNWALEMLMRVCESLQAPLMVLYTSSRSPGDSRPMQAAAVVMKSPPFRHRQELVATTVLDSHWELAAAWSKHVRAPSG